jgi:anti-sigma factor RsiW
LVLEHHLRGDSSSASGEWAEHLKSCPQCVERLAKMRTEDAAYRASSAAHRLRALLQQRAANPPPPQPRSWMEQLRNWPASLLVPVATVAVAAVLLVLFGLLRPIHAPSEQFTTKGGGLELSVIQNGAPSAWAGEPLHRGEALQLGWSTTSPVSLAVFARESDGTITVLFPEAGDRSATLLPGAHQSLGGSVVVDGKSLRLEAFASSRPFALEPLRAALSKGETPSFEGRRQIVELPGASGP